MTNLEERHRRLLMEQSSSGRVGYSLPTLDVPEQSLPDPALLRNNLTLPEVSEPEIVRYFTSLSQLNFSIDTHFYPLGSCTMKYNPKINEEIASLPGMSAIHPLQNPDQIQGALQLMYLLQTYLADITGMAACSLAPLAGAQGELSGVLMIRSYHKLRGEHQRRKMLIPDSAHGTNAASATMAGFNVVSIPTNSEGNTDMEALRKEATNDLAGMMITLPSTLGIFDLNITDICNIVHKSGGLVYADGANMNALLGQVKLGDLGFDVMHLNLHKTFSTPHGGGGPGSGPVCAQTNIAEFLPAPTVTKTGKNGKEIYRLVTPNKSIGKLAGFHGNFGVLVKAYSYIRSLGNTGLRKVSENAVLNANYLWALLKTTYRFPFNRRFMHEILISAVNHKQSDIRGLDISKRLLDYGFHAPTMYFPLTVEEALLIEPTETESKETLESFVNAMRSIENEAEETPDTLKTAPHSTPVKRLDEVEAARHPDLRDLRGIDGSIND